MGLLETTAIVLVLSPSDIPTVLDAVTSLNMMTSHALVMVLTDPYQAPVMLDYLVALGNGGNRTDVLDSVFAITFKFPTNGSESSGARRRRSVTEEGHDVMSDFVTSEQSASTSRYGLARFVPVSLEKTVIGKQIYGVVKTLVLSLKDICSKFASLLGFYQHSSASERNERTEDSNNDQPTMIEMAKKKEQLGATRKQQVRNSLDVLSSSGALFQKTRNINTLLMTQDTEGDTERERRQQQRRHQRHQQQHGNQQQQQQQQQYLHQGYRYHLTQRFSVVQASHSLHKREASSLQSNGNAQQLYNEISPLLDSKDLLALHDAILALGYILDQHTTPPSLSLPPRNFSAEFQGTLGRIIINGDTKNFDAVVYDYEVMTGFVQRWYFSSTSPATWEVSQSGSVVWPKGQALGPDECFMQKYCEHEGFDVTYIIAIFASVVGLTVIIIVIVFFVKRYWAKNELTKGPNKVILSPDDLVFLLKKDMGKGSKLLKSRSNLLDQSRPDLLRGSDAHRSSGSINELSDFTQTARYNGDLVHVKELKVKNFEMKSKIYTFVRMLRDIRHENCNPYVGLLIDPERPALVMEYCIRGSLKDMLHNEDIKLDWDFKLSLLTDLVRGLRYLHNCPLKIHGHLTSRNCVIDSRFVLKITDYGIPGFLEKMKTSRDLEATDLLWTAPEMLRDEALLQRGTEKGDVYSLSIIFQEVALRTEPYSSHNLTPEEIIKKVRKPPPLCRPSVSPQAAPPQFIQTMKQCWSEMPDMRPTVEEVYEQFKKLTGGKKANIVDTMFKMLEKYSNDLEDIVAERTEQLEEEKKKTDQLLFRMLPSTVAESLKLGRTVEAETFSEVTIYFSDIVGFTTISALSTPMQVVDLLNDLYTMFDATIERYDVYKVETIGDAYMVVSGLPLRNGNRHAGEISTMALDLLSQCGHFTIKHMPHVPLRLRIGLHSGSCVAGVVGLTMPRFCLFGDTVNTASRMESTGAAFRIHISETCKNTLDELGGYRLDFRGETELKGKGLHKTWWLVGKEGVEFELPEPPPLHGLGSVISNTAQLPADLIPTSPLPPTKQPHPSGSSMDPGGQDPSSRDRLPGNQADPDPRPCQPLNPDSPRGDAGFDSGRGESSDGDSPQSPKGTSGVGRGGAGGGGGGDSRNSSQDCKGISTAPTKTSAMPNSVVTRAEIYNEDSSRGVTTTRSSSSSHNNENGPSLGVVPEDSFPDSQQDCGGSHKTAAGELGGHVCGGGDHSKLERRETGDSGVDVKSYQHSLSSFSDISDRGKKEDGNSLTPVSEV